MTLLSKKLGMVAASAALSIAAIEANPAQAMTLYTNPDTGNQYFVTELDTWEGAQAQAEAEGGNLVTINDAAEQMWLWDTFGRNTTYWIGFTDRATEGTWEWVSGEPVTFRNWSPGEPNNHIRIAFPGGEDYATMDVDHNGLWNDLPVSANDFRNAVGIAEIEPNQSVPEPGMVTALAIVGLGALGTKKLSSKGSDN